VGGALAREIMDDDATRDVDEVELEYQKVRGVFRV
jgi:hypothetical protein